MFDWLVRYWRTAAPSQKAALAAGAGIAVAVAVTVSSLISRPSYSVLYARMPEDQAAGIVSELKNMKVPYRLSAGNTIEVPQDAVYQTRLDLASLGLPRGGGAGFELLDHPRLGLTEFGEKMTYLRALQGELARTIGSLDPVAQARVHLVVPEPSLYLEDKRAATATVVVALRSGARLSAGQVRSVTHLVAASVEGLNPQGVTVVDQSGLLLTGDPASGGADRFGVQAELEGQVAQKVQTMLDTVLGAGNAVVRVSASVNLDRKATEQETFEPASGGTGVVEKQQESKESSSGGGTQVAAGVPGTASNVGEMAPSSEGIGGSGAYSRSESTAEYRVGRKSEQTTVQPGRIERLCVAVLVDRKAKGLSTSALRKAVEVAAGVDRTRGDEVALQFGKFDRSQQKEGEQLARRAESSARWGR